MNLGTRPITNARHNVDGTIDLELNHPIENWIPFTASPHDTEAYGRAIHARALDGEAGPIAPHQPPSNEQLADEARAERDQRLARSDWTQLSDVPEATRLSWRPYRQALRDLPEQPGFPTNITWPEPPAA